MKTRIIQSSFPRSASTLLVNALYGLIIGFQDQSVYFTDFIHTPYQVPDQLAIFKTHDVNLDQIATHFNNERLLFICSERNTNRFDDHFRIYDNVAVFDFDDVNNMPPATVCDNLAALIDYMAPDLATDTTTCVERLQAMNQRYEEIKHMPFSYVDPFFQLHGSHRRRISAKQRSALRGKHPSHV